MKQSRFIVLGSCPKLVVKNMKRLRIIEPNITSVNWVLVVDRSSFETLRKGVLTQMQYRDRILGVPRSDSQCSISR